MKFKLLILLTLLVNSKLFCCDFLISNQYFDNIESSFSINLSMQRFFWGERNILKVEKIYNDSIYKFVCNQNEFEVEGDFDSILIVQNIDTIFESIQGNLYSIPNSFSTFTSINLYKTKNGYNNYLHILCDDYYSMDLDSFYKITDSLIIRKQHSVFTGGSSTFFQLKDNIFIKIYLLEKSFKNNIGIIYKINSCQDVEYYNNLVNKLILQIISQK